jgi:anti-sigma factor RsiW
MTHLTEDQRHGMADGSLEPDAHLQACAECAADVDRIRRLMKRIDRAKSPAGVSSDVDEAWPAIRDRIERSKVVTLGSGASAGGRRERRTWIAAGLVAAGLVAFAVTQGRRSRDGSTDFAQLGDSGISFVALVDSSHAYQEEAQALLNRLELRRATMRPELAQAVERDLRTIDVAIAELQNAIRTDPNNPALRRLLASSYRQKVDLLKRASDAG